MNRALEDLLTMLADAKELLGSRLAAVCVAGPRLETAVSSVALAQTELGHSRVLRRLARQRADASRRDDGFLNPHLEGDLVPTFDTWIDVVAVLSTLDVGLATWLGEIAAGDTSERLTNAINRILEEEVFHQEFTAGWLDMVTTDPDFSVPFSASFDAALGRWDRWERGLLPAAEQAHEAGVLGRPPTAVRSAAENRIRALVPGDRVPASSRTAAGVDVPVRNDHGPTTVSPRPQER